MRHKPSTSTRTVPSGNFTILDSREMQPTSYKSSGAGSATSALRCNTAPNKRSPATMSSISLRLGPVSMSSGTTAPGKITMSERPRMGTLSGSEREEMRGVASAFSAASLMLTNSVSGDDIVAILSNRCSAGEKIHAPSVPLGNRNFGRFGLRRARWRHVHPQKTVHINRLGLAQVVARRQIQHGLERSVIDLHHKKAAMRRAAAVRPVARNAHAVALNGDLEVFAFHAGQFHLDDESGVGGVNVRVRHPAPAGGTVATANRRVSRNEMNRGTDFGYGHDLKVIKKYSGKR